MANIKQESRTSKTARQIAYLDRVRTERARLKVEQEAERAQQEAIQLRQKTEQEAARLGEQLRLKDAEFKRLETEIANLKTRMIDLMARYAKDGSVRFGTTHMYQSVSMASVKHELSDEQTSVLRKVLPMSAFKTKVDWDFVSKRPDLLETVRKNNISVEKTPYWKFK